MGTHRQDIANARVISRKQLTRPIYRKRNDHFAARVWRVDDMAVKAVRARHSRAARLLYREHEFLTALGSRSRYFPRFESADIQCSWPYKFAMNWVDGVPLYRAKDVPGHLVVESLEKIAAALRNAGIQHRDITERNLIWTGERAVLVDFGWAVWNGESAYRPPTLAAPDDDRALERLHKKWSAIHAV